MQVAVQRYTFKAAVAMDIGRRNALMQPGISVTVTHTWRLLVAARLAKAIRFCVSVRLLSLFNPSLVAAPAPSTHHCCRSGKADPRCRLTLISLLPSLVSWFVIFIFVLRPPQPLPLTLQRPWKVAPLRSISASVSLSLSLSCFFRRAIPSLLTTASPRLDVDETQPTERHGTRKNEPVRYT